MKIKSKLNWCFILSIVALVLNGLTLAIDIVDNIDTYYLVFDVVYLVCGVISTILFGIFRFNKLEFLYKHNKLFILAVCSACICSLILAIFAFMAYFEVMASKRFKRETHDGTIETEGKVIPTAEEIAKKIKVLDDMLQANTISQEEYDRLKQEILSEITK